MNDEDNDHAQDHELSDYAQQVLTQIVDTVRYWQRKPQDDLNGPDYAEARLVGLVTGVLEIVDKLGDDGEMAEAVYELRGSGEGRDEELAKTIRAALADLK